jgi:tRNA threonylcarbamoyladenosine biosynthesis protein TsaE
MSGPGMSGPGMSGPGMSEQQVRVPPVRVPTGRAMRDLGVRLAGLLRAGDLVVLSGALGSGKTTLTQGIGEGLKVRGPITSPTFVIARVHPSLSGGPPLVHVDAYRLSGFAEVDDLDLDASLNEAVTVVEWGAGLVEGLAVDRLVVEIAVEIVFELTAAEDAKPADGDDADGDEERIVQIMGVGDRWTGLSEL